MPLPVVTASELVSRPPPAREWAIDRLVPAGTVTLLVGDGGAGKTTLALQLAAAVSAGGQVLGRRASPGGAIVFTAEDDRAELHRRVAAVAKAASLRPEQLSRLKIVMGAELDDPALAREGNRNELEWTPLYASLLDQIAVDNPSLIVVDPLSEVFQADENNRKQVARFVGQIRRVAQRSGSAVILLGHPSISGAADGTGRSGSTAWGGAVRHRLFMERVTADPDTRKLRVTKSNLAPLGDPIFLRWREGVFEHVSEPTDAERAGELARARGALLAVLTRLTSMGRTLSPSHGRNFLPTIAAREHEARGLTKEVLEAAMRDLLASGVIRAEKSGPRSRQRAELVVAEAGDRRPFDLQSPLTSALRSPSIAFDPSVRSIPLIPPTIERSRIGLEPDRPVPLEDPEPAEPEIDDETADVLALHC